MPVARVARACNLGFGAVHVLLTEKQVVGLAPLAFENMRSVRYRAEEQALDATRFTDPDLSVVRSLYAMLASLEQAVSERADGELADFLAAHDLEDLLVRVRGLGGDRDSDARLAAAYHDIRGGALTAILIHFSRLSRGLAREGTRRALLLGIRDHRKMMRNVLADLDPDARARDLAFLPHSLEDLASALRGYTGEVRGAPVRVKVQSDLHAVVAESCVECSALDRMAYNLLGNAVRHADEASISVWLLSLGQDLRVVVGNRIAPAQRGMLERLVVADEASMYGSFTTTGSGLGLGIVADLTSRAYGVTQIDELVAGRYVGVELFEDVFASWFHWPLAGA